MDISGQRHRATTRAHGGGGDPRHGSVMCNPEWEGSRALPRSEAKGRWQAGRRQTCAVGCCGCGAGSRERVTLTQLPPLPGDATRVTRLLSGPHAVCTPVRADSFVPFGGPLLHAGGGPCTARRRLQVVAAVRPSARLRVSRVSVRVGCRSPGGAAALRSFVDEQDRSIQRRVSATHFRSFAVGTMVGPLTSAPSNGVLPFASPKRRTTCYFYEDRAISPFENQAFIYTPSKNKLIVDITSYRKQQYQDYS